MRTLTIALIALVGALALAGAAQAKGGPFTVEVSGGGLAEPVAIEGQVAPDVVFAFDGAQVTPPEKQDPAYSLKLTYAQAEPDGATGELPIVDLTYFPAEGDALAILRGNYSDGPYYFQATPQFQSMLDDAIAGGQIENDDGMALAWYLMPAAGAVGLVLAGGLAGRRFLHR